MADGDLHLRFAPDPEALAGMRRTLRQWLADHGTPIEVTDDLVLAADELCANAIGAATGGEVHLEARGDGTAVHLAVTNAGHAPAGRDYGSDPGDGLEDRGRGLAIVRELTDSLAIVNVDGHTVARAVRLLDR